MDANNLKCDVCSKRTIKKRSFVLTTTEITSSENYWKDYLPKLQSIIDSTETEADKFNVIVADIHKKCQDTSAWLVCETCSYMFDIDRDKAKKLAYQLDRLPVFEANDTESIVTMMEPLILKIVRKDQYRPKMHHIKNYWQCSICGIINSKEYEDLDIYNNYLDTGNPIIEKRSCGFCTHDHELMDIFTNKFDLYVDDDIITEMANNPNEGEFIKDLKLYRFRGKIIKGPGSISSSFG